MCSVSLSRFAYSATSVFDATLGGWSVIDFSGCKSHSCGWTNLQHFPFVPGLYLDAAPLCLFGDSRHHFKSLQVFNIWNYILVQSGHLEKGRVSLSCVINPSTSSLLCCLLNLTRTGTELVHLRSHLHTYGIHLHLAFYTQTAYSLNMRGTKPYFFEYAVIYIAYRCVGKQSFWIC